MTQPNAKQIRSLMVEARELSRRNCSIRQSLCWVESWEMLGKCLYVVVRAETGIFRTFSCFAIGPRGGIRNQHINRTFY